MRSNISLNIKRVCVLLLLSCFLFAGTAYAAGMHVMYVSSEYCAKEAETLLACLNEKRTASGMTVLTADAALSKKAMQRAVELSVYYGTVRPDGKNLSSLGSEILDASIGAGEEQPEQMAAQWLAVEKEKSKLLNAQYTRAGIGCARVNEVLYWVVLYAGAPLNAQSSAVGIPGGSHKTEVSVSESIVKGPLLLTASSGSEIQPTLEIDIGEKRSLKIVRENRQKKSFYSCYANDSFIWCSSDKTIVRVDQKGTITALAEGEALLTVKEKAGIGMDAFVRVSVKRKSVTIKESGYTVKLSVNGKIYTGKKLMPKVTVKHGTAVLVNGKDYHIVCKNNKNPGIAQMQIIGKGEHGKFSEKLTFRIYPSKVRVLDDQKIQKKNLTVRWKKCTGVTGYQVRIGYRTNSGSKQKLYTVAGASKTHKVIKNLPRRNQYGVMVRAYKKTEKGKLYGKWSQAYRIMLQ